MRELPAFRVSWQLACRTEAVQHEGLPRRARHVSHAAGGGQLRERRSLSAGRAVVAVDQQHLRRLRHVRVRADDHVGAGAHQCPRDCHLRHSWVAFKLVAPVNCHHAQAATCGGHVCQRGGGLAQIHLASTGGGSGGEAGYSLDGHPRGDALRSFVGEINAEGGGVHAHAQHRARAERRCAFKAAPDVQDGV